MPSILDYGCDCTQAHIVKAEEEMEDDGLTIYDIEQSIFPGKILERQKYQVTSELKYWILAEWFGIKVNSNS